MAKFEPGLYERLLTESLRRDLDAVPDTFAVAERPLDVGDAADRIALHVGRLVERAVLDLPESQRVTQGVELARRVLARLGAVADGEEPAQPASVLQAILAHRPDGSVTPLAAPLIPLLDTTLLTNAPGEPTLWSQLISEIASADAIDVVMAFVRRSGIRPLLDVLRRHCAAGKPLRVLTTTYTGSTEPAALEELTRLGAQVRVSYETGTTRLHAKAWLFQRRSGMSTAYVGSSNLTHTAQVGGLEWNVRASAARNADVLAKVGAVFDSYWASDDFVPYDAERFEAERRRAGRTDDGRPILLSPLEVHPHPFQARLLELLEVARSKGHHRNLLVSATGTGKTVMAALDYDALRARLPRARLAFIAHREEILDQSRATFRHVLRSPTFGEKWVGGARPTRFDHVFASIQSLHVADLDRLPPDHFDIVIVDEFHHAAAASYERLLAHLRPVELLGLTATPERSDGLPILGWFDGRIAAELRLWDAIAQQHLAPFLYFGLHDGTDLRDVPWKRGRGYDVDALSGVYTGNEAWARLVVQEVRDHADVATMRALGFCVSVDHARFMAERFTRHGIPAVAIWGDTPWPQRQEALGRLADGSVRVVFSVDLFNEGVDVPSVDTILMLRPTESPTLFLQQLGRGLRRAAGKTTCTVLDFVGTHRREFRFDRRFQALLGGSRTAVIRAVEAGFPFLPAGCHIQLDPVAADVVLRSLRDAIPTRWAHKVAELAAVRREDPGIGLAGFLAEAGLDLDDVYDGRRGWSDLLTDAGAPVAAPGPHETVLRRGVGRLLHVDDHERLGTYRRLLGLGRPPRLEQLAVRERRLLHMLVAALADQALARDTTVQGGVDLLWRHPQIRAELRDLFGVLDERIDHVHTPLATHPDCPLQVHARYSRIEILVALGLAPKAKVAAWQSGVYDAASARADLLAFTLDKSSGGFSPTTRYRDYAISRTLIHWESQSVTRADSTTGLRYRHHARDGRSILLFSRLHRDDRAFWFLGPARYRGHVGERPMAITWELDHPLPGDLFQAFAAVA
jgi:superfamily II DNA or RNA helicase/HKD family nuclease